MNTHVLKTDKDVFTESWRGIKLYEIRFDDRNYQIDDQLILVETEYSGEDMQNGKPLEYTGFFIVVTVNNKLKDQYGLRDGWCILSVFQEYCGNEDPHGEYFVNGVLNGNMSYPEND